MYTQYKHVKDFNQNIDRHTYIEHIDIEYQENIKLHPGNLWLNATQ